MNSTSKIKSKPSRLSLTRARKIRMELKNSPKKDGPIAIRTYNSPSIDNIIDECANKISTLNTNRADSPVPSPPPSPSFPIRKLKNIDFENESSDECVNKEKKRKANTQYQTSNITMSLYLEPTNMIDKHDRKRSWKKDSFCNEIEYINSTGNEDHNNAKKRNHKKKKNESSTHLPSDTKPAAKVTEWKHDYDDVSYSSNDRHHNMSV